MTSLAEIRIDNQFWKWFPDLETLPPIPIAFHLLLFNFDSTKFDDFLKLFPFERVRKCSNMELDNTQEEINLQLDRLVGRLLPHLTDPRGLPARCFHLFDFPWFPERETFNLHQPLIWYHPNTLAGVKNVKVDLDIRRPVKESLNKLPNMKTIQLGSDGINICEPIRHDSVSMAVFKFHPLGRRDAILSLKKFDFNHFDFPNANSIKIIVHNIENIEASRGIEFQTLLRLWFKKCPLLDSITQEWSSTEFPNMGIQSGFETIRTLKKILSILSPYYSPRLVKNAQVKITCLSIDLIRRVTEMLV